MDATHLSLLTQARSGSHAAWTRMVELYQPLIYGWLRRHGVSHHDAEELSQDSLLAVARELPRFSHSGNVGAFRLWVYRITANRARAFWRAGRVRATATGDSRFRDIVEQFEDPGSELSQAWEREHDRFLLLRLLETIQSDFTANSLTAFRRQVFDGATAEQVAAELGITVAAVYSARSRILQRLRREAEGLVDDSALA